MLHLHLTAIIVSFILFIAVYFMYKKNNTAENKSAFIMHMVLRVFYLLVLFSGIMVYVGNMEGISNAYVGGWHQHRLYPRFSRT